MTRTPLNGIAPDVWSVPSHPWISGSSPIITITPSIKHYPGYSQTRTSHATSIVYSILSRYDLTTSCVHKLQLLPSGVPPELARSAASGTILPWNFIPPSQRYLNQTASKPDACAARLGLAFEDAPMPRSEGRRLGRSKCG